MKKTKIIHLVLVSASLSSCSKYLYDTQSYTPAYAQMPPRTDTIPDQQNQQNQELYIDIQNDIFKLWQGAFTDNRNRTVANMPGYLRPVNENSFMVNHPVISVTRAGFGNSAHSAAA
jgi:hypothetical protein